MKDINIALSPLEIERLIPGAYKDAIETLDGYILNDPRGGLHVARYREQCERAIARLNELLQAKLSYRLAGVDE
jgi:hypothetical protein